MQNMTLSNAVRDFAALTPQIIDEGEIINVATETGNIIILSENIYKSLLLTAEVNANTEFKTSLLEGLRAPLSDFVSESEVVW